MEPGGEWDGLTAMHSGFIPDMNVENGGVNSGIFFFFLPQLWAMFKVSAAYLCMWVRTQQDSEGRCQI